MNAHIVVSESGARTVVFMSLEVALEVEKEKRLRRGITGACEGVRETVDPNYAVEE